MLTDVRCQFVSTVQWKRTRRPLWLGDARWTLTEDWPWATCPTLHASVPPRSSCLPPASPVNTVIILCTTSAQIGTFCRVGSSVTAMIGKLELTDFRWSSFKYKVQSTYNMKIVKNHSCKKAYKTHLVIMSVQIFSKFSLITDSFLCIMATNESPCT